MEDLAYKLAIGIIFVMILFIILMGLFVPSAEERKWQDVDKIESHSGEVLEITIVDGCEYVLWHNGYGSDMEHHGNCKNH